MRQKASELPFFAPAVDTRVAARVTITLALIVDEASLNLTWRCSHTLSPTLDELSPLPQVVDPATSITASGEAAKMSTSEDTDRNDWDMLPPA
jgi:hypothetical protein